MMMKTWKTGRIKRYYKLFAYLFLVIGLFLISFICLPFYKRAEHKIVIEADGIMNAASLSDGVQIQKVIIDGQNQDLTDIFLENDWHYEDDMFTWNSYASRQTYIEADIIFRKAEFYFLENPYCGAMTCYVDGKEYFSKDLYNTETNCYKLMIKGEENISFFIRLLTSMSISGCLILFWRVIKIRINLLVIKEWLLSAGRKIGRTDIVNITIYILLLMVIVFNLSAIIENHTIEEVIEHDVNSTDRIQLSEVEYVRQDIGISAKTTGLVLYFFKKDFFSGCVHVSVKQNGETVFEKNIYAGNIENDSKCTLDIPELNEGNYTIFVEGVNEDNNDVSLVLSRQKIFEKAWINGESYDGNMALSLKTNIVPRTHRYRVYLFAGLLIVVGIVLWNMPRQRRKVSIFYICTVLLHIITICIQFPCYSVTPEVISETGSNFYQMTYLLDAKDSIYLDDAGYWPLFQRLISIFIICVLHQQRYAVFLMQGFAVLFTAFAFSRLCLSHYRNYAQDRVRFAASLFVGISYVAAYGDSCLAFHNFTYLGIVLVFFNMMLDLEHLNKIIFAIVTAESALLCLSKGRYGIFFPLYILIFMGYLIRKIVFRRKSGKEQKSCKRQMIYMSVVTASAFVQMMYMLNNTAKWDTHTEGLGHVLMAGIYYFVQSFITVFIPCSQLVWNGWMLHIILVLLLICAGMILIWKWKRAENTCSLIIIIIIFTMGSSMLNAIMQNEYKDYAWGKLSPLAFERTNIFMITGAVFVIFLFCRLVREKRAKEWIYSILLIIICIRFTALKDSYINDNCFIQADWKNDYQMFQNSSYVIPLWNEDRFMVKNAYVLYLGAKSEEEIDTSKWNYTTGPDVVEQKYFPYSTSSVFETAVLRNKSINSIYAKKLAIGMDGEISVVLYDENGTLLCRQKARPAEQRLNMAFVFDMPVYNVSRIEFVDNSGKSVQVRTDLLIGICEKEN